METPILLRWDGDAFAPASQFWAKLADREFVVGEQYRLVEHKDRSANSHRHFFATVNEAWRTLPDHMLDDYPTAEHLRKKALIRKGFHTCRDHVCATKPEAQHIAAFIRPMDDYAIIIAKDCIVRVYTAMSQQVKAMGAKDFQESKQAVLDFIDDLLGVERGATAENARRAA